MNNKDLPIEKQLLYKINDILKLHEKIDGFKDFGFKVKLFVELKSAEKIILDYISDQES